MAGAPGIAARVFSALAAGSINVVAIAQGSSERNISFAVTEEQAPEAVRRVHTAFQLSKIGGGRTPAPAPTTDVVLLGFGRVGRALADQIAATNNGPRVRVVGLLDRSGYVFDPRGISNRKLLDLARKKDEGGLLSSLGGRAASATEALAMMATHAVSRPVIVDVTSDETADLPANRSLTRGFDPVLANKRPLAGSLESYSQLWAAAESSGRRVRYEATVGAGPADHRYVSEAGGNGRPRAARGWLRERHPRCISRRRCRAAARFQMPCARPSSWVMRSRILARIYRGATPPAKP